MTDKKLAVIGGGQMGRALVGGMLAKNVLPPELTCLVEPSAESQAWWREHHPEIKIGELTTVVPTCEYVLLAVKPNMIATVTKQKSRFWTDKLVVSIAAGVSLDKLCTLVGHKRVVRVMPNTPSLVGAGASAFCCAADVTDADQKWIQSMLDSIGLAVRVEESQMDAVTGLSGSGPAYVCMIIEAMADGGVQAGLPRQLAMQLATQTVFGTAKMIAETKRHPGELKDAVASPGGTTIAAISVLEQNGIRAALIQAVVASANRSQQMGKEN
jgi:pyrroline-5-carboxylate reductase